MYKLYIMYIFGVYGLGITYFQATMHFKGYTHMILDDLKAHLVALNLAQGDEIIFDFDSKNENTILIKKTGSNPTDLGFRSKIEIVAKNTSQQTAITKINEIWQALCPQDNFQKAILINNKTMHTKTEKEPYFRKKDQQGRFYYVFEMTVTY